MPFCAIQRLLAEHAGPASLFVVLTLLLTWPQVRDIDFSLPGTKEGVVHADPLLNVWTLAQAVENVLHPGRGLFTSNAFWPRPNTLAYSDHLLGWLPLAMPLAAFTENFVFIFNLLYLSTFVLCAFGAYLLVREVTGHKLAGVLGGVLFAFCPFRMTQAGHFAGLAFPWLPYAMLCVHRYLQRPLLRYAWCGLFCVFLQTLSSGIYGLFFCVFLVLFLGARALRRRVICLRGLLTLSAAGILLAGLLLPFYWPNLAFRRELGFLHSQEENVRLAADLLAILGVPEHSVYEPLVSGRLPAGEGMFPGLLALALALAGVVRSCRRGGPDRETALVYLAAAAACWMLSLGPRVKWNGQPLFPGPYALLQIFPAFDVLRMANRFGALLMMCLAVLAGLGARDWLEKKPKAWRSRSALLLGILLLEYTCVPRPLGAAPDADGIPEVYRWLRTQPDEKVLIEMPYTHGYGDAYWMYFSIHHRKRILNGYSSYTPPEGKVAVLALARFPSPESVDLLGATGADYVVVHGEIFGAPMDVPPPGLERVARFGSDQVFRPLRTVRRTVRPSGLMPVPAGQVRLSATPDSGDPGPLLSMEGSPWPSGGFVHGRTELRLECSESIPIRSLELQFEPHADLFPAAYEVWAEASEGEWRPLAVTHHLTDFYLSARERPRRPALWIDLPPLSGSVLLLRPGLPGGHRAWPLAGLRLWRLSRESAPP
ncbi:MAG: hypothetical protein HYU36_20870 [Planctomycetes bacterium]|nr:hypothetical protein [Planctomycetota bacterium]